MLELLNKNHGQHGAATSRAFAAEDTLLIESLATHCGLVLENLGLMAQSEDALASLARSQTTYRDLLTKASKGSGKLS